jgi:uncharacterized protein (UPF0297 family)
MTNNKLHLLDRLLESSAPKMTEMLCKDIFDMINKDPIHSVEKIKGRVAPLSGNGRYISLLDDERIIIRKFSSASPVIAAMRIL